MLLQQFLKESNEDADKILAEFKQKLKSTINPQNVKLYVDAFLK